MGNALDLSASFKNIITKQMTAVENRTHTNSYRSFSLTCCLYFWKFTMSIPQNGNITETVSQQLLRTEKATGVCLSSFYHIPGGMKRTCSIWQLVFMWTYKCLYIPSVVGPVLRGNWGSMDNWDLPLISNISFHVIILLSFTIHLAKMII